MFKDNLKKLRKLNNCTQAELAKELGVSNKTVSHWENNYSQPDLDNLIKIKKILNVSYEDLLED